MDEKFKELASEGERLCKNGDFKGGISFFEIAIKLGTSDTKSLSNVYSQLANAYFILANNERTKELPAYNLCSPSYKTKTHDTDSTAFDFNMLTLSNLPLRKTGARQRPHTIHIERPDEEEVVSENELVRELLFALQGLNGRILVQDQNNDGRYKINIQYSISPTMKQLALRLSNLGWLLNKINRFCLLISKNASTGHVCQSFAAGLLDELNSYYGLITKIEQMLHFSNSSYTEDINESVSLIRLQMMTFDSFCILKMLVQLLDKCKNKRGGSLVNAIYQSMQDGDPLIRECVTRILRQVVLPIRLMLSKWLFHGELEDSFKEFFITSSRSGLVSPGDALWHEKYSINKSMLPGFISISEAKKILATGKAVILLKQIGANATSVASFDELKKLFENTQVENLFYEKTVFKGSNGGSSIQMLLNQAYHETSERALKLLVEDYQLMNHLRALRQFLLLGQGDFIRHLMDVLNVELDKTADELKEHRLTHLLNSAIRCTNAQYFDEDVLDRIDVQFRENSSDDIGWDIFTLTYQTRGPISTILTAQCMNHYSTLFKHLWRSKRMEYILTQIWKRQVLHHRFASKIPVLKPLFHQSLILLSEMMHFIQQLQYYIEFEVIESSWVQLLSRVKSSKDIDELVDSHDYFLNRIMSRCMLDGESQELQEQLRTIYEIIIEFNVMHENFNQSIDIELEARSKHQLKSKVNDNDKQIEKERRNKFEQEDLSRFCGKLSLHTLSFQEMTEDFLVKLAGSGDQDLRVLSLRIDFNEFYKKKNKELQTSFTYSKHRYSVENSFSLK